MNSTNLNEEKSSPLKRHFVKNWLIYLLIILGAASNGYQWLNKKMAVKAQQKLYMQQIDQLINEREMEIDSISRIQIQIFLKTLSWAFRSEAIRANYEQMDLYLNNLIKEDVIEEISLLDKDCTYWMSSNKKNEQKKAEGIYQDFCGIERWQIETYSDSSYIAAIPVMGLESKIAVAVLKLKKHL